MPNHHDEQTAKPERIGLVLAGGGARGAYEMGALSVLLPELEALNQRVSVIVGTSVGALNAAWLASKMHLKPTQKIADRGNALWRQIRWEDVMSPVWSPRTLLPAAQYVGLVGPAGRVESLLDCTPLTATVAHHLDKRQLAANVRSGVVHAVAVVATAATTGRSVAFHTGGPDVPADEFRGIDYVRCGLTAQHVRASAAIPSAFRPVKVTAPKDARGWYVDGGTRLNTPIKPALELGADRVIVVALNTTRAPTNITADDRCPDVYQGLGHMTQAVLADPLAHDVRTLARLNMRGHARARLIPYMLIEPKARDRIGEIAGRVYAEHYRSVRQLRTSVGALGRLVHADAGAANGELLSYLFFAPEFADALMHEGAEDARAWLSQRHDDGVWQHGPLDESPAEAARRGRAAEGMALT